MSTSSETGNNERREEERTVVIPGQQSSSSQTQETAENEKMTRDRRDMLNALTQTDSPESLVSRAGMRQVGDVPYVVETGSPAYVNTMLKTLGDLQPLDPQIIRVPDFGYEFEIVKRTGDIFMKTKKVYDFEDFDLSQSRMTKIRVMLVFQMLAKAGIVVDKAAIDDRKELINLKYFAPTHYMLDIVAKTIDQMGQSNLFNTYRTGLRSIPATINQARRDGFQMEITRNYVTDINALYEAYINNYTHDLAGGGAAAIPAGFQAIYNVLAGASRVDLEKLPNTHWLMDLRISNADIIPFTSNSRFTKWLTNMQEAVLRQVYASDMSKPASYVRDVIVHNEMRSNTSTLLSKWLPTVPNGDAQDGLISMLGAYFSREQMYLQGNFTNSGTVPYEDMMVRIFARMMTPRARGWEPPLDEIEIIIAGFTGYTFATGQGPGSGNIFMRLYNSLLPNARNDKDHMILRIALMRFEPYPGPRINGAANAMNAGQAIRPQVTLLATPTANAQVIRYLDAMTAQGVHNWMAGYQVNGLIPVLQVMRPAWMSAAWLAGIQVLGGAGGAAVAAINYSSQIIRSVLVKLDMVYTFVNNLIAHIGPVPFFLNGRNHNAGVAGTIGNSTIANPSVELKNIDLQKLVLTLAYDDLKFVQLNKDILLKGLWFFHHCRRFVTLARWVNLTFQGVGNALPPDVTQNGVIKFALAFMPEPFREWAKEILWDSANILQPLTLNNIDQNYTNYLVAVNGVAANYIDDFYTVAISPSTIANPNNQLNIPNSVTTVAPAPNNLIDLVTYINQPASGRPQLTGFDLRLFSQTKIYLDTPPLEFIKNQPEDDVYDSLVDKPLSIASHVMERAVIYSIQFGWQSKSSWFRSYGVRTPLSPSFNANDVQLLNTAQQNAVANAIFRNQPNVALTLATVNVFETSPYLMFPNTVQQNIRYDGQVSRNASITVPTVVYSTARF